MKIKYNIDAEKGIVAAYFISDFTDIASELSFKIDKFVGRDKHSDTFSICLRDYKVAKKKLRGYKFVGVAKCAPEDEFDEEVGKRIARERLLKQYRAYKYDVIKWYREKFTKEYWERYHRLVKFGDKDAMIDPMGAVGK